MNDSIEAAIKEIEKCKKWDLTLFEMIGMDLEEIPDELNDLRQLEHLNLGHNKLIRLSQGFRQLSNLKLLKLTGNRLTEIPEEIFELENLTSLDLSDNQITKIPDKIGRLKNLKFLNLSGNHIKELPINLSQLRDLEKLEINDNPITIPPPEILQKEVKAILRYLGNLAENQVSLNETKLIVVGEGGVGKTSLMKKLLNKNFTLDLNEKSTKGISIEKWRIDQNHLNLVNFWDFGGQAIYHSLHQLFFTRRTLYLFVWEARKDEYETSFVYWLNMIRCFGNNSPVLIIQNKIDDRKQFIDEAYLRKKFPNIVGFYQISVKDNTGVDELRDKVLDSIKNLPDIQEIIPEDWYKLRQALCVQNKGTVSFSDAERIGKDLGIESQKIKDAIRYFHDTGVLLHFDQIEQLRNMLILKPIWFVEYIYRILDSDKVQLQGGFFSKEDLIEIWRDISTEEQEFLFHFLTICNMHFKVPKEERYCIPELLTQLMPQIEWKETLVMRLKYEYDFMPQELMSKLLTYFQEYIKEDCFWKNGMLLDIEDHEILFQCFVEKKRLIITIKGEDLKTHFEIIQKDMKYIHKSFILNNVEESIQCICDQCRTSDIYTSTYFSTEALRKFKERKVKKIICEKSILPVFIDQLLGDNSRLRELDKMRPKNLNNHNFDINDFKPEPIVKYQPIKIFLYFPDELSHDKDQMLLFLQQLNKKGMAKGIILQVVSFEELKDKYHIQNLNDLIQYEEFLEQNFYFFFLYKMLPDFNHDTISSLYDKFLLSGKFPGLKIIMKSGHIEIDEINQSIYETSLLKDTIKKQWKENCLSYRLFRDLESHIEEIVGI